MLHDKDIDTRIGLLLRFAEGAARLMGLPALVALCTEEMIALLAFDCIFNKLVANSTEEVLIYLLIDLALIQASLFRASPVGNFSMCLQYIFVK